MKDFLFRKAQLSDVPILVEIYMKKLLKDFSWDITMQKMFQERYKESIPRLMKKETLVVYLAYQQETLVGMYCHKNSCKWKQGTTLSIRISRYL